MKENSKWLFQLNFYNILLIVVGAGLNLLGYHAARMFGLPIWLDSVGTFYAAVELGPIAGALAGAVMNVIAGIYEPGYIWFAIVSIGGGIAVGRCYPRNRKVSSFSVIATGFFAGIIMTILATPINMIVRDGYVGNPWGDALVNMLSRYMSVKWPRLLAGELLVEMPDKVLSVALAMLLLIPVKWMKGKGRKRAEKTAAGILVLAVLASLAGPLPVRAA